ncbi:hypothetical protein EJ04DRAFT_530830 [Polyplosphaeria fusca]|uniref:protein disulfide-isomerase n=1 Tax=Polyplosphaeria fusca TaxID=682080 RepID=A0A9P4RCM7_9PLEO|nr:hypothetical protein EJ04DRAFT_530830 [Polyplosphaeria fusca]
MEFCKEQDVNAYPAIKLFHQPRDGEAGEIGTERYRGKRTVNAIKSFVTKWELPVMSYVPAANLAYFKSINDIVVVAYVRKDQVNLVETFGAVAKRHWKDFVFGYVTEAQAVDAEGLAMPALALYKNTDGENKVLNGPFKETDVETLLEGASSMLIGDFNERTMDQYMRGKLSGYIFVSNENEASAVRKELTPVVRKLEKYLAFGIADAVEYAPMARSFGLSKDVFPALVVHAPHNDNVFTYKQGRKIVAPVVDDMLNTILHSKAQSGQIFGENAPEMGASNPKGHDEL